MTPDNSQIQSNPRLNRRWFLIATVTVLVAAGISLWTCVLEDRFIPKRFGVVEQGLIYRSGQLSPPLIKKFLTQRSIRVIIDLTFEDPNNLDQQAEKKTAEELNVRILRFPLGGDGTGDVNNYARAITAIADAEKNKLPMLVHCAAGAQRTGGVIAAYRLLVQKKDPAFVINELKRYGWKPKSNPALLTYLNNNMAELASLLKQTSVIDEIPAQPPQLPSN
jgi:protein tyrosine/serine phosphatase